ncbi:MAG: outer membrane beta-barrel protein [Ignavibacteriae bacterium]|nr:outer membrane beta-barrel protein [Ignavibacteriota bacterium]
MKNLFGFIFALLLVCSFTADAFSGDGNGIKLNDRVTNNINLSKSKFEKDYEIQKDFYAEKTGKKLVDFYIDLQLGYGSTNANIDSKSSSTTYNTSSSGGFNVGGVFYLNIADAWSFSSGLDFFNKKFEVETTDTNVVATDRIKDVSNQYLNIPLYFNVGGMISDKVGLTFMGGPYLGLLLSTDEEQGLGYKNFDLGLAGTLTGNYLVAPLVSVILGTKFQYGGLNNLGSTETVESIHTTNFTVFSGVRFGL